MQRIYKLKSQNFPSPIIKKSIQHHLFDADFHTKTPYHLQIKPYDKQTQPTLFCKKVPKFQGKSLEIYF